MKMTNDTHLTQTEKRAIKQMIENGFTQAHNRLKTKVYTIIEGKPLSSEKWSYKIAIDTRSTFTIGRGTETRRQVVKIEIAKKSEPIQKSLF